MNNLKPILEASYLNQNEASEKLKHLGYTYDPQLSTNESKVFIDKDGKPNIAFRGSKRVTDFLVSDLLQGIGLQNYDKRFQEAKHLTKMVEDKYNQPANTFGHSLGGKLSEASGAHGNIYTYNKATRIFDIGKTIPQNQVDVRTTGDVVSMIGKTQNHKYNNMKTINSGNQGFLPAHNISNLDITTPK